MLRFSVAVSMLLVACATKGSGIDSESHFACNSDADCAIHDGRPVCVEHVCEPPDGSAPESGGSTATGGRGAMSTAGGAGGAGGHGNAGAGGTSRSMVDAAPPPTPDAAVCRECTKDLTLEESLDCYCRSHSCDADLAAALVNPKWEKVDAGCGLVVVHLDVGPGGLSGQMEAFDRSGRLVGAMNWNDIIRSECISPDDNPAGFAAGGNSFVPNQNSCNSLESCVLTGGADGGPQRCDLQSLLRENGEDAGAPCATGEILASVCTSCLAGCGRRELKCVKTCGATSDCTAAHVTGTCVDSICQEFCPF